MDNPRILVVDDDPSIRKFVQANLEAKGYQILTAANGEETLRLAEKEKPELIILDIVMLEMDGFTVCGKIREWSTVSVIMLSLWDGDLTY
jgi:DNA-binding response OmpR family regulator